MADWSGEKTFNGQKFKLWEMHLQGKFRGIKLERSVKSVETVVYYFIGNPHHTNAYNTNPGKLYQQALETLGNKWATEGSAPQGQVKIGGTGITANFRGASMPLDVCA